MEGKASVEEPSVLSLLSTFSKAVGAKEWDEARRLAQMVLEREPDNAIVAEFLPLLERAEEELDVEEESEEESTSGESGDEPDEQKTKK